MPERFTFYHRHKKKIDYYLVIFCAVLFICLFRYIFRYIAPFVIGYFISLLFEPLSAFLVERFKLPRWLIAIFNILLLLAIIGIIGVNLITTLINQAQTFISNIPTYWTEVSNRLSSLKENVQLNYYLDSTIGDSFTVNFSESLSGFANSLLGSSVTKGPINAVKRLPSILLGIVLTFISCFFFMKDKYLISRTIKGLLPDFLTKQFILIKQGIIDAISGYVRAQFTIMSIIATICVVGLTIIRYPYSLFLGFVIAFIDALPILGSGFILWPWAIFSLINNDYQKAIALFIIYGIILLVRQIIEPKILGSEIGIHPLLTLISIYAGLQIFGLFGFIIGPIILVTIKAITKTQVE